LSMATPILTVLPQTCTNEELESKVHRMLREEMCGVDTAAMVLSAARYPMKGVYDAACEIEPVKEDAAV